jgi:hypothetical protein
MTVETFVARSGDVWRRGRRWLCPRCSTDVRSPYSKAQEESAALRHGTGGRAWCSTCEDYIVPLEVIYVGPDGG